MHMSYRFLLSLVGLWLVTLTSARAQRTLFNMPQAEIIEYQKLFFQAQLAFTNQWQGGLAWAYGIGKDFEVGLNVNNLTGYYPGSHQPLLELRSESPEVNPDLTLTLQKGVGLGEWGYLGVGTRTGVGYRDTPSHPRLANFTYATNLFTFGDSDIKPSVGGYYTTPAFAGPGNRWGYMVGLQAPFLHERMALMGEYISGTNLYSNLTLGLAVQSGKRWQVAVGAQIPAPHSSNSLGGTIQLSLRD
ncbi:hypothetical protein SAMN05421823_105104 [Catalinimonas alkaloidigena]|uniref:MetA-pathway of phenol degradation n=1 Tax=Catalinimonas alkaloidigena TaxID=1075417 RepID=A0A1G9ITX4_9BACT|nr:hypothetical protein [Catalinimonas alkaloidigena]SDL28506.1 hypothetical protein SAMN05421823_105104 [Catalinimonas alkaloidigena]